MIPLLIGAAVLGSLYSLLDMSPQLLYGILFAGTALFWVVMAILKWRDARTGRLSRTSTGTHAHSHR